MFGSQMSQLPQTPNRPIQAVKIVKKSQMYSQSHIGIVMSGGQVYFWRENSYIEVTFLA